MKKILFFVMALALSGGVSFADVQIDSGQSKATAPVKFFVARNARQATFPNVISKDSVVIWDSTSNDGVTVTTSTTSNDGLVVGITMDEIPGSSRDNTASTDEGYGNWGRVQCWGRYNEALWAAGMFANGGAPPAGSRVGTSATAQQLGLYQEVYQTGTSNGALNTSKDHVGVLLEAAAAGDTAIDVFVDRC